MFLFNLFFSNLIIIIYIILFYFKAKYFLNVNKFARANRLSTKETHKKAAT